MALRKLKCDSSFILQKFGICAIHNKNCLSGKEQIVHFYYYYLNRCHYGISCHRCGVLTKGVTGAPMEPAFDGVVPGLE
jgi:hypothetical protein